MRCRLQPRRTATESAADRKTELTGLRATLWKERERERERERLTDELAEWPRAQNRGVGGGGGRGRVRWLSGCASLLLSSPRPPLSRWRAGRRAGGSLPPFLPARADGLDKEKSERNSCRARRPDGRTRTPVLPLKDPRARKEYQKAESKSIPIPSRPTFEWQDVKLSIMGETMRFEVGAGKRERRVVVALCLDLGASGRATVRKERSRKRLIVCQRQNNTALWKREEILVASGQMVKSTRTEESLCYCSGNEMHSSRLKTS